LRSRGGGGGIRHELPTEKKGLREPLSRKEYNPLFPWKARKTRILYELSGCKRKRGRDLYTKKKRKTEALPFNRPVRGKVGPFIILLRMGERSSRTKGIQSPPPQVMRDRGGEGGREDGLTLPDQGRREGRPVRGGTPCQGRRTFARKKRKEEKRQRPTKVYFNPVAWGKGGGRRFPSTKEVSRVKQAPTSP